MRLLRITDYSLSKCLAEPITIVAVRGRAFARGKVQSAPFVVRVALDDARLARTLPADSRRGCDLTGHVKATHAIRKILLRQITILNYVNPRFRNSCRRSCKGAR